MCFNEFNRIIFNIIVVNMYCVQMCVITQICEEARGIYLFFYQSLQYILTLFNIPHGNGTLED